MPRIEPMLRNCACVAGSVRKIARAKSERSSVTQHSTDSTHDLPNYFRLPRWQQIDQASRVAVFLDWNPIEIPAAAFFFGLASWVTAFFLCCHFAASVLRSAAVMVPKEIHKLPCRSSANATGAASQLLLQLLLQPALMCCETVGAPNDRP